MNYYYSEVDLTDLKKSILEKVTKKRRMVDASRTSHIPLTVSKTLSEECNRRGIRPSVTTLDI
jgi:hypothetical protein